MQQHGRANSNCQSIDPCNQWLFGHDNALEKIKDRHFVDIAGFRQFQKIRDIIAGGKGTGCAQETIAFMELSAFASSIAATI